MPSRPPLVLLPPSEGKAPGGGGPAWQAGTMSHPELDGRRARVMASLATAMRGSKPKRAALMGVKDVALAAATEANLAVASSPTSPAMERYTGVLYGALDYPSLPAAVRRRADAQIRIVSGLWGLVAPTDPIPDYKLKMGASLARTGKLSTWWRPAVTEALAPEVADRVVWDLLANEHRAAWSPDLQPCSAQGISGAAARPRPVVAAAPPRAIVSVRFADAVTRAGRSELVTVAHWNKLLKGALVRHVLATQLVEVEGLVEFDHPLGYVFDPSLTEVADDGIRCTVTFVKR